MNISTTSTPRTTSGEPLENKAPQSAAPSKGGVSAGPVRYTDWASI